MDRPPHEYPSSISYPQPLQPQQPYGYPPPPPPPQFHSGGGGATPPPPPHPQFLPPPHPSMPPPPQFLYHHHHHHPPPPHLLHHPAQPTFPHPPPPPPQHFPPPPPPPPPSDPELHKRIDKLVEYAAKNGPEFEAMIRDKQKDNPDYAFLFGGDAHPYFRHKLWLSSSSSSSAAPYPLPPPPMIRSPLIPPPPPQQPPFFFDHHQHSQFYPRPTLPQEYDQHFNVGMSMSRPLPADLAAELSNVLATLNGTKESIKGAKFWFVQRSVFAQPLAEALRDRVFALDDHERQLHIVYLVNDILFESMHRRINDELDNEALAFKHVLASLLARIYHHPRIQEDHQTKLQQLLQLWASNNIYDLDTINMFRNEMVGRQSVHSFPGPPKDLSTTGSIDPAASGLPHAAMHNMAHWHPDRQIAVSNLGDQEHLVDKLAAPPPSASTVQPTIQQQPAINGEKVPPYPLFPPGLIPGMVRKMQIGSGVPYSSMSPLDIPTIIPPLNVSQSEILERVSKFFKEIGEVNPSEGPLKSGKGDDDGEYDEEYEREAVVRKGGACIPPPPNLQADPETGTYPDGSMERKPGFVSSGRLGLGATANPNEISQYDDVYTSYRKQRSTNYHSSMSARATAR